MDLGVVTAAREAQGRRVLWEEAGSGTEKRVSQGIPDNELIEGGMWREGMKGAGCHDGCFPGNSPRLMEGHQEVTATFQQEGG